MAPALWAAAGATLGLVLGSFIATLVLRWPAERSLAGRSACDGCGKPLGTGELVPLLSFAVQRGRCRGCGAKIDPLHPAVELAAAALGATALWLAPGWDGLAVALFGWTLLALGLLDARHFWLPDALTLPLLGAGLLLGPWLDNLPLTDRLIGAAAGFGALWAIGAGYRWRRGRDGLGGGDPKLLAAIGAWLGWAMLPWVVLAAALLGLAWAGGTALANRAALEATDRLPLGALLAAAAWPAALWLLSLH